MATVVHVAPDAEAKVEAVRAASTGAASAWDGMLVARILAAQRRLAATLGGRGLDVLRGGRGPAARVDVLRGNRMNLTPREKDKLLISMAAMVARRRWSGA